MSISRFRRTALALSNAVESAHHGKADFRVGKRIFATLGHPDENWGTLKLTPEQQSMLVDAEPDIFRPVPGGWGRLGATRCNLGRVDEATLASALKAAHGLAQPREKARRRR